MNYSGSYFSSIKQTAIETGNQEKIYYNDDEEKEIERIMNIFEKTRLENPLLFSKIITLNKELMDIVTKREITKDELNTLNSKFDLLEMIKDDFTFWVVIKGIKTCILETKNLDIIHFFLIKKSFELSHIFYKNILTQFIRSVS